MSKKSRTYETSGFAGVKPHYYKTEISDEKKTRSGVGKTATESQRNAKKNWDKSSGGSSSGGGCFLTTACVAYQGLSDDCEQLTMLRRFRDDYILELPNGGMLIEEYYTQAPKIVSMVEEASEAVKASVYSEIFNAIQTALDHIKNHEPDKALAVYAALFTTLNERYLNGRAKVQ